MRLIITRHGETDYNIKGIIQGQIQSVLTSNGRLQAEALARRLKEEKITRIISSPLHRAVETAKIINRAHGLEIEEVEGLIERSFGIYQGNKEKDYERMFPGCIGDPHYRPPKGENIEDVMKRLEPELNKLMETSGTVLLVGHLVIDRMLLSLLQGISLEEAYKLDLRQTSVSIFEIMDGDVRAETVNDISHLEKENIKTHGGTF